MTDEVVAFLLEPERLKQAVELVAKMEDVKEHIFETYWKNVRARLDGRLSEASQQWQTFGPTKVLEEYSAIGIAPTANLSGHGEHRDSSDYRVVYECLAGRKHPTYLGVQSGKRIGSHAAIQPYELEIETRLTQLGLKRREEHWIGWQYISELGLPAITSVDLAVLVLLNDDNCQVDHPLADHAAQLLWAVFSSNRELLEKAMEAVRSISPQ